MKFSNEMTEIRRVTNSPIIVCRGSHRTRTMVLELDHCNFTKLARSLSGVYFVEKCNLDFVWGFHSHTWAEHCALTLVPTLLYTVLATCLIFCQKVSSCHNRTFRAALNYQTSTVIWKKSTDLLYRVYFKKFEITQTGDFYLKFFNLSAWVYFYSSRSSRCPDW